MIDRSFHSATKRFRVDKPCAECCLGKSPAVQSATLCAALAQSVEQRIRNAKVTSSIPVSGTKNSAGT